MMRRLYANWVYGGMLAGVLLLLLAPLLIGSWPIVLALTYLYLPVYMLHQYEEHDDDRFRRFVNANIGKGKEVLSPAAVFVINVPGVWGVIALSLYLAARVNIGLSLIAVYLVLVNGVVHIVPAAVRGSYNPGLGTAIVLFLPFGAYSLRQVQLAGGGTPLFHGIGLLSAVAIHVAIVLYALRRRQTLALRKPASGR
jgi:hypothetical protein